MNPARLAYVTALVIALGDAEPARADERPMSAPAAALWTEGQQLYQDGKYDEAIDRFERGRAIEPRAEFLYAAGQAARKAGDCRRAIELYRRFVVEADTPARVEAARLQITRCETELAEAQARPATPMQSVAPPLPPAPERPPDARVPWYRDTLGISLLAGGLVAAGAGTALVLRSRRGLDDDRDSYGQFEDALAVRKRDRTIGFALLGVAGALTTGAVVRFAVWPERAATGATGASVGVTASISGRF